MLNGYVQAVYGMFSGAARQQSTPGTAQGRSAPDARRRHAADGRHSQLQAVRLVLVKLQDRTDQAPIRRCEQEVEQVVVVDMPGPRADSLGSHYDRQTYCRGAALVWKPGKNSACSLKNVQSLERPSELPLFFEGHDERQPLKLDGKPGICDPRRKILGLQLRRQAVQLAAPDAGLPNLEQSANAAQAALDNVGVISALLATVAIGTYFVVTLQLQYEDSELGIFLRGGLVTSFLVLNAIALFASLAAIIVVGMTPLLVALRKAQLNTIQAKLAAQPEHYFRYAPKLTAWRRCVFECMRNSLAWSLCFLLMSIFCFAAAATLLGFNQLAANQVAMWLFPAAAIFFLSVLLVWVWQSRNRLQFEIFDDIDLGMGGLYRRFSTPRGSPGLQPCMNGRAEPPIQSISDQLHFPVAV